VSAHTPLLLDLDVLARMCGSAEGAEDGLSGVRWQISRPDPPPL